jgi:hypothetical protein
MTHRFIYHLFYIFCTEHEIVIVCACAYLSDKAEINSICHFLKSLQCAKVRALPSLHLTQILVDCLSIERVSCRRVDIDKSTHPYYRPHENAI